jgi:hypothetical protein
MVRVEGRGSELNPLTISRANVPSAIKGRESEDRSRCLAASPMNRRILRVHSRPLSSPQELGPRCCFSPPRARARVQERRFALRGLGRARYFKKNENEE